MRKVVTHGLGLLCVFLGSLMLSGCPPARKDATTVVFWALGAEGDNVRVLVDRFEMQNPGVKVEVQAIPWTAAHEKLLTSYAGRSMPDIFQLGNTWIPEFHVLGALEDLRPWLARSTVVREESYFPGVWRVNVLDSALLGIPWYVDTRVLYYRTDLFAAVGFPRPPKSWGEWFELAQRLRARAEEQGKDAYAILLPTNEWGPPVVLGLQNGSPFLKDRNTLGAFSDSAFRQSFEFYASFFRHHLAPVGVTQVTNIYQGISEGFFAMYMTGPWNIGEFRRRLPPEMQDRWMTAPLPSPDGRTPGMSLAGGSSLAMSRSSKNKAAVWKFIEYLSDPRQQLEFYRVTGDLPSRKEAWEDTTFTHNQYIQAFYEQLNYVAPVPQVPEWEQIVTKLQLYSEAASRGVPVPEVLAQLDRDVNSILEKRRWLVYGK
jgi:multiple sugar transport system substrate-binding protein